MALLGELHRDGATIIIVTHDPRYARHAERTVKLFDGRIVNGAGVSPPGSAPAAIAAIRNSRRVACSCALIGGTSIVWPGDFGIVGRLWTGTRGFSSHWHEADQPEREKWHDEPRFPHHGLGRIC